MAEVRFELPSAGLTMSVSRGGPPHRYGSAHAMEIPESESVESRSNHDDLPNPLFRQLLPRHLPRSGPFLRRLVDRHFNRICRLHFIRLFLQPTIKDLSKDTKKDRRDSSR